MADKPKTAPDAGPDAGEAFEDAVNDLEALDEPAMSEAEAAVARDFARALETPPPVPESTRDNDEEAGTALEGDLAAVALLKTQAKFELNAPRQEVMREELMAQFEHSQARSTEAKRAAQASRSAGRGSWWRWLPIPALAAGGAFGLYLATIRSTPEQAVQHAVAQDIASPSGGLLRAQAEALAAASGRNDQGEARRELDREMADYRAQMIASLEVKLQ
jgi:hypothetical protein